MAEFGFLTSYIYGDGIEEIDINSWRDIEVQYSDGRSEKLTEHFDSPEHALAVIRRMLHASGMVLDNASPLVTRHLTRNTRIAAMKSPVVDEDVGVPPPSESSTATISAVRICCAAVRPQRKCWTGFPYFYAMGSPSAWLVPPPPARPRRQAGC